MINTLLYEIIGKYFIKNDKNLLNNEVEKNLEWIKKNNCTILDVQNNGPTFLKNINGAPRLLFIRGNIEGIFCKNIIAIVGTRYPTTYGTRAALKFSQMLAERGIAITSGLAHGIDTMAHKGALSVNGITIAVLGSGLANIYPKLNKKLSEEIIEKNGVLVSEYPPFIGPQKHFFPQRNRIISGLSKAIFIIEAPARSGALITASFAIEQGRDVFVLPGQFDDDNFIGNHILIQQGAKLIYKLEDILEEMPPLPKEKNDETSPLQKFFMENGNTMTLSEIFSKSGLNLGVLIELLETEIKNGTIFEVSPQKYVWINK